MNLIVLGLLPTGSAAIKKHIVMCVPATFVEFHVRSGYFLFEVHTYLLTTTTLLLARINSCCRPMVLVKRFIRCGTDLATHTSTNNFIFNF